MNVLITGASGFIGGRLAEVLASQDGFQVTVSGRSEAALANLKSAGISVITGYLTDQEFAEHVVGSIDVIVHCAGLAGTWGDYDEYYRANVLATKYLLDAAKSKGVSRFINISSPSIYLNFSDQFDIGEDFLPAEFSNHYARTKYEAEQLVQAAHNNEFLCVSLRPRMVIGAGDNNLFPRLLRLQEAGLLKCMGDGENVVSMTSIDNLIELIIQCFDAPKEAMGQSYNVANAEPEKLWQIIDQLCEEMGLSSERKKLPYRPIMALAKLNEKLQTMLGRAKEPKLLPVPVSVMANSMTLDISRAKRNLSYAPKATATKSVSEFVAWWKTR